MFYFVIEDVPCFENYDLENITTPVNVEELDKLLKLSGYDRNKSEFLVKGFRQGFKLNYQGPMDRCDRSKNLPFHVGNKDILWPKVMKEVEAKRYAGPFQKIPYDHFVQSPIGLVPKGEDQTRLIFHLSYDFTENKSVNHFTPKDSCSVKYRDLDHAIKQSLRIIEQFSSGEKLVIWYVKSDLKSTFPIIPLFPGEFWLLIMAAEHPVTGETFYFVDKCLPFGHSISCALFQSFSDGLAHMVQFLIQTKRGIQTSALTNYLDDFLFAALAKRLAQACLEQFMEMCKVLGVPILMDKTEWPQNLMTFLGILLDGIYHLLAVPEDKRVKTLNLLTDIVHKKKATVCNLQQLAGVLNFLNRAIVPAEHSQGECMLNSVE